MKAEITICMDNAAFQDCGNPGEELSRILMRLGKMLQSGPRLISGDSFPIMDINGNKVGYLTISD